MDKKALYVLEYEKIIELLKGEAGSELSRQMVSELKPYTDVHVISEELRSTTEAVDLIAHKGVLPTGGIYDVNGSLALSRKGGTLTTKQLLQVCYNLNIASAVVRFMESDVPELPLLNSLVELIVECPRLAEEIDRCIISEDEISDNASGELRDIRRNILRQNEAIRVKLNRIINSQANRTYLQDAIVTIRDGRYVIPVKQEHRSHFPGLVHDQSKAGATLFIEPQAVVELNNQLRELEIAEQTEIARILAELSSRVAENYHAIKNNQDILLRLDFIMAKGRLSVKMEGSAPTVGLDQKLKLVKGRHPLIDSRKVVPLDMELGGDFRTLIITGPNTGGKTVSLKTVGLLALMVQSGLHIPASELSTFPVFENIFADIGDEQSIEQSLSTFSSHMKNIVKIIDQCNDRSLVLFDELGAGTDPTEGAALAIAVLEAVYNRGAWTMATTHYNELKKYALSAEGVENGSMEFNVDTLSPTYRLSIGVPGKSNAFEISKKLGLNQNIIDRASELIEGEDMEFENVISAIEEDKKKAEEERDQAIAIRASMKAKEAELDKRLEALKKKEQDVLAAAREEARDILREARDVSKDVQKELKELSKLESMGERNRIFDKNRKKLKETEGKYAERVVKQFNNNPVKASDLKVGDRVKLLSLDQNGEILTLPDDKGDLQVKVGIMKVNVNLDDLVLINDGTKKNKNKTKSKYGNIYRTKSKTVSPSINVQGMNLEDAFMEVEKYLDDVYIAGLEKVTIIHGRGEGILKDGIRSMLKKNKTVKSFKAGNYNEGGQGVTIVTMKKD